MSRFVMISFIFMGWSFYELSGGNEFVPPVRPEPIAVANLKPAPKQQVTAASLVTKSIIQPVQQPILQPRSTKIAVALPDRPDADPNLRSRVALAQISAIGNAFGFDVDAAGADASTVQLASLSGGLAPLAEGAAIPTVTAPPEDRPKLTVDMRHVTASLVNMRGGPGTIYPVVTQLHNDVAVEVLDDSGTGWLHLRVVDDEQTGWIAASLISKKRP